MNPDDEGIDSIQSDELTREEFEKRFLTEDRPVVIRGGMTGTPAWRVWTKEYLVERAGHRRVRLKESRNPVFNPNADSGLGGLGEHDETFAKALEAVTCNEKAAFFSIMQQSIPDKLPELLGDVPVPRWMPDSGKVWRVNLWISAGGGAAPLHFDSRHNFIGMIGGRKRFELFAPSETANLYPATESSHRHISQLDLSSPDMQRFPRFKHAVAKFTTLEPGDLLFLPSLWWHFVRSLDLSFSVNYWWDTPAMIREKLAPHLKWLLDAQARRET